jgi:hypothetical protein
MKKENIQVLEKKVSELNEIWVEYFFSYPYFQHKIKFTEEEKNNYVGVLFGYFRDSFDVVFAPLPNEFNSYVDKFTHQIAFLQSIYVQQDLVEELLRIFKTGIERDTLKKDSNFNVNRKIRNELIGHPISRDSKSNLRSSTVFGYEKSSSIITYLRYEFPNEKDVVQHVSVLDILTRHVNFLNTYLDKLLEQSYSLLTKFKNETLDVLSNLVLKNDVSKTIDFSLIHFKEQIESIIGINLSELKLLIANNSHPRYSHSLSVYWKDICKFSSEVSKSIERILSKENLLPVKDIVSNLDFTINFETSFQSENNVSKPFLRKNYNYELGKIATKRNFDDFTLYSGSIYNENADEITIIEELEHLKLNLNNSLEFGCAWNYLKHLLNYKLAENQIKV